MNNIIVNASIIAEFVLKGYNKSSEFTAFTIGSSGSYMSVSSLYYMKLITTEFIKFCFDELLLLKNFHFESDQVFSAFTIFD